MSPTTRTIFWPTLILGGLTIGLLLVVVSQLHSYTQSSAGGWNLAFNILTARASPFGTPAGAWAVALAVWGFLLVPAVAGAVAALILAAYLTRSEAARSHVYDKFKRQSDKRLIAGKKKMADAAELSKQAQAEASKAAAKAKAKRDTANAKQVEAATAEAEAATAEAAADRAEAAAKTAPAAAPPQDGQPASTSAAGQKSDERRA
jgi:hypothetical protein